MNITEYVIIFTDGSEYISEDKSEADTVFDERTNEIDQYYNKTWVQCDGQWEEDYVEVYYSKRKEEENN